jgi:hypothetical protein
MTGGRSASDDEAHLAALLAVLALARAGADPDGGRHDDRQGGSDGTPLQRWRAGRLAALASSTSSLERPSPRRCRRVL